ncbi:MAG: thiol reductant ABC exporter subunit CydD [Anaerolineaceae bacterium]|nr:thiol reductant ABC exporter subunit CydD [Anaerolineaceae bacterium]
MNQYPRLTREARLSGWLLPAAVFCGFVASGLIVLQSWQLSAIISRVFLQHQTPGQILPLMRLVFLVVCVRAVFTFLNEVIAGKLAVTVKLRLRKMLLEKLNRLGPAFLKNERTGELTTNALQGVDALDAYFSQYLPQVLIAVLLPITILIVVFPIDLLTGIIFAVTAPLIPLFMVLIGRLSEVLTRKQWLARTRLGGYFLDTLQGIATLKMLGRSRDRAKEVKDISDQYRIATLNVLRITFLSALVLELVATLSTAVVAVEIGLRLLYARVEFQQAFFILLIAPEFYFPLRQLSARYHAGMAGITAAQHIYAFLDVPEPKKEPQFDPSLLAAQFDQEFTISLRGVAFAYESSLDHSLRGIDLTLEKGKHYVLVGKSGSGKSTLAQLLLRFVLPDDGEILINDLKISAWPADLWRRFIGWVPQRPSIFHMSLLENITLGNESYRHEEIQGAVAAAGLSDLVKTLDKGWHTSLKEGGSRFSGGEAQRVALARAFLKDPKILILDEPTAHLDLELEQQITRATQQLMEGRTTLTIAHRISTIKTADEIIVLDKGELIDKGSHAELFSRCEVYRELINSGRRWA